MLSIPAFAAACESVPPPVNDVVVVDDDGDSGMDQAARIAELEAENEALQVENSRLRSCLDAMVVLGSTALGVGSADTA